MPLPALALSLLSNRFVQIGIAVVVTALVVGPWAHHKGYKGEHEERLKEVASLQSVIDAGAIKAFRLSEVTGTAIAQAERKAETKAKELEAARKLNKDLLKEHNELLKSIVIPDAGVSLFNRSTGQRTTREEPRIQNQTNAVDDEDARAGQVNLGQLLEVATDNNINHQEVIEQVESLQKFICALYDADGQPLEYPVCRNKP